jgi:predicted lipoprotein
VIALIVIVVAALVTKVVKIEDDTTKPVFSAEEYANLHFEPDTMPWILDHAVDLGTLLDAIETDEEAAKLEYGNSSNIHNAYSYPVTFTGLVNEVEGDNVLVTVDGVSSDYTIRVQLVPGTGTALRDVTGMVDLNDLLNQVEYLNVSLQFNYKMEDLVLVPFLGQHPMDSLPGQTMQVVGAYTDNNGSIITVVPISLGIVDGNADQ